MHGGNHPSSNGNYSMKVQITIHLWRWWKAPLILWTFGPAREQHLPGPEPQEIHMTEMSETQMVSGEVTPISKRGNPAKVQAGSVRFVSSDSSVITATQDDPTNELKVTVKSVAPGAARLSCKFDADLGDGITDVELFEDFSIIGGQAIGGTMKFGTPSEQP